MSIYVFMVYAIAKIISLVEHELAMPLMKTCSFV